MLPLLLLPCCCCAQVAAGAANFNELHFSMDGALLLAVGEGRVHVLDSYEGKVHWTGLNGAQEGGAACFSPDSQVRAAGWGSRVQQSAAGEAGAAECWRGGGGVGGLARLHACFMCLHAAAAWQTEQTIPRGSRWVGACLPGASRPHPA